MGNLVEGDLQPLGEREERGIQNAPLPVVFPEDQVQRLGTPGCRAEAGRLGGKGDLDVCSARVDKQEDAKMCVCVCVECRIVFSDISYFDKVCS